MTWEIFWFIAICTAPVLYFVVPMAWQDYSDYRAYKRGERPDESHPPKRRTPPPNV